MEVCVDYAGRSVVIDREWWVAHVVTPRPKMAAHYGDVIQAIASPNFVHRDKDDPDRECLYGPYVSHKISPRLMVKVVVEYDANGAGSFITAYPCSRPGSGEVQIWTKPK